ncbi:TRAP transporter substrate-binding protein [Alsobacter sp. R-9]
MSILSSSWFSTRHCLAALAAVLGAAVASPLPARATSPQNPPAPAVSLRIVGGLAGVNQYKQHEAPFWLDTIRQRSGGRIAATIQPFDQSGLRAQDMLQLMRVGVVPFGTALLSVVAADDPELNAMDLPGLAPDIATLRKVVSLYRPHTEKLLLEQHNIVLLGVYAYPAQVVYCAKPFSGLSDLAGRRVRTSSVSQSEMFAALGAVPVITPFAEMVGAVSKKVVDCAVTGTLSGNEVGLTEVTTHIHAMAINWGLSIFGANRTAWEAVPADLRPMIRGGVAELEQSIWSMAEQETLGGIQCNVGADGCRSGRKGRMALVPVTTADEAVRRKVLVEAVLPRWIDRCGTDCVEGWNAIMAPELGLAVTGDAGTGTTVASPDDVKTTR